MARFRLKYVTAAVAFAAVAGLSPALAQVQSGWSKRGVFVFGSFLLDFQEKLEVFSINGAKLEDCSSEMLYCARGSEVRVVLPRSCEEMTAKARWTQGGVTTDVLAVDDSRAAGEEVGSLLPTTVYLLGSRANPYIVYVYTKALGVQEIFFDGFHKDDLARLASTGGIAELAKLPKYRYRLTTLDVFGHCRNRS